MKVDPRHIPVLLHHVMAVLQPAPGMIIADCTLGLGGHAAAMLAAIKPNGHLLGIDFDAANIEIARTRLSRVEPRDRPGDDATFTLSQTNFAALDLVMADAGLAPHSLDGVLADIGVASTQIDDPQRGFSYRRPGPLDMRMDPRRGESASALIARLSERELAAAIFDFADETDAPAIAALIVQGRAKRAITTTEQLSEIICEARNFTPQRALGAKLHPAARTFQALRILVNREMANLERLLTVLPACLKSGGTAAIITFHSGEDRRVKHAFAAGLDNGTYSAIAMKPLVASSDEAGRNPRARPAKLRWARRV